MKAQIFNDSEAAAQSAAQFIAAEARAAVKACGVIVMAAVTARLSSPTRHIQAY